jgi:hypothetical protein
MIKTAWYILDIIFQTMWITLLVAFCICVILFIIGCLCELFLFFKKGLYGKR